MIVLGAVVPHPPILLAEIGQGRQAAASRTLEAYDQLAQRLRDLCVDRCVLISSHGIVTLSQFHVLTEAAQGNLGAFGAERVEFSLDPNRELVSAILTAARNHEVPLAAVPVWETSDHASAVPLTLLGDAAPTRTAVVGMSFLSGSAHYTCGRAIGEAAARIDGNVAIIASGDGVHTLSQESPHGFHPLAKRTQAQIERALATWDYKALIGLDPTVREAVDESIVSPALILMGAMHGLACRPRILSSEAPWGVGYISVVVEMD